MVWLHLHSLKLTANAPENRPKGPKRKQTIVFQPCIFRGENVSLREGTIKKFTKEIALQIYQLRIRWSVPLGAAGSSRIHPTLKPHPSTGPWEGEQAPNIPSRLVVSNMVYVHPETWGNDSQFDEYIFFKWVGETRDFGSVTGSFPLWSRFFSIFP